MEIVSAIIISIRLVHGMKLVCCLPEKKVFVVCTPSPAITRRLSVQNKKNHKI